MKFIAAALWILIIGICGFSRAEESAESLSQKFSASSELPFSVSVTNLNQFRDIKGEFRSIGIGSNEVNATQKKCISEQIGQLVTAFNFAMSKETIKTKLAGLSIRKIIVELKDWTTMNPSLYPKDGLSETAEDEKSSVGFYSSRTKTFDPLKVTVVLKKDRRGKIICDKVSQKILDREFIYAQAGKPCDASISLCIKKSNRRSAPAASTR